MQQSEEIKKLIFFNFYFNPSDSASAVLLNSLIPSLTRHFKITVVCGVAGDNKIHYGESSVTVVRFPQIFGSLSSKITKFLDYLICFLRMCWYGLTLSHKAGVPVILSDPPFIDSALGLIFKARGIKYIISLHDVYPDFAYHSGNKCVRILFPLLKRTHNYILSQAETVICVADDYAAALSEHKLLNMEVVQNWASPQEIQPIDPLIWKEKKERAYNNKIVFKYAGNLGNACDLEGFEKALKYLKDPDRFIFLFQSYGVKKKQLEKIAANNQSVKVVEWKPRAMLNEALTECDVHLILTPADLYGSIYPSKIYSVMAAAKPVLASIPVRSSMHALIQKIGCGISVSAEDPKALAEALDRFAEIFLNDENLAFDMGANGRRFTELEWNDQTAAEQYLSIFKKA